MPRPHLDKVVLERPTKKDDEMWNSHRRILSSAVQGPVNPRNLQRPKPMNPAVRRALTNFLLG